MQMLLSAFILQYSNETAITALIDCVAAAQTNKQRGCKYKLFPQLYATFQRSQNVKLSIYSNKVEMRFFSIPLLHFQNSRVMELSH